MAELTITAQELLETMNKSVRRELDELMPQIRAQDGHTGWKQYQVPWPENQVGDWRIEKFNIPRTDFERIAIILRQGLIRDPGFGDFTKLSRYNHERSKQAHEEIWEVWMSDSRAEIFEHLELFEMVGDEAEWLSRQKNLDPNIDILINGLGLGMSVRGVLLNPYVRHVDVVELVPEVIELIGPYLPSDRVTIHQGDALTYEWPKHKRWTFAWHDIWQDISPENLPQMTRLHRRYQNRVTWQGSWRKETARRMRILEAKERKEVVHLLRNIHVQVDESLKDPEVRKLLGLNIE